MTSTSYQRQYPLSWKDYSIYLGKTLNSAIKLKRSAVTDDEIVHVVKTEHGPLSRNSLSCKTDSDIRASIAFFPHLLPVINIHRDVHWNNLNP